MTKYSLTKIKLVSFFIFGIVVGLGANYVVPTVARYAQPSNNSDQNIFQSSRFPISFKYPSDFPVMPIADDFLYQRDNWIEFINLGALDIAPLNPSNGEAVLIVTKLPSEAYVQKSPEEIILQEYRDQISNMKKMYKDFNSELPVLEKIQIGNVEGYKVLENNPDLKGTFDNTKERIIIVRPHGIIITILVTPRNPERAAQLQDVLKSLNLKY